MRSIYFLFLSVVFSLECIAEPAGWYDAGKVTRVHSGHGNGTFLFSTEKNLNIAGCQENYGYNVKEDASNSNRIYSTLLAAYASGKPVAIYITGVCLNGRPEVNAVQIKETGYF